MKKKFFVLFVVVVLGFMMSGMSGSAAEEYSDDTVISQNTILGDNIVVSGKLTVKDGATLTVPEGIVLTVKEGASVEARGNIDIKGKIIVEKGGRFFRKEYLIYQEIVGPEEDAGFGYTPLIACHTGSVEISNGEFHFPMGTAVRVARSSVRLWNEKWTMEHETEIKYNDGVKVNVSIYGPDFSKDTTQYSRIVFGFDSGNTELRLLAPSTYYWVFDESIQAGKWQWFNGLEALSGSPDSASSGLLAWANAFYHNARMLEPELTSEEAVIYRDQVYDPSRNTRNQYNLFIPTSVSKEKPVSLILFMHGGSWTSGSKEDFDYGCARMARKGYITATVDYRLFEAEQNAANSMEDIMDDIQNCINAIYEKTSELGYTIDKMATSGYSAGGHLALLYAYSRPDAAAIPVKLVFEEVGPADFDAGAFAPGIFQNQLIVDSFAKKLIPNYGSMTSGEKETALDYISPITYVNTNTVPTVMAYAAEDIIVGYQHGVRLDEKLSANGIEHVFYTLEKSNHTCEFDSAAVDNFWNTSYEYCERYLTSQ